MARFKYIIFFDLTNSYFQVRMAKDLWPFLGVLTPHRGIRVITRAGQGLFNSDNKLEQLLSMILGDEIKAGNTLIARDDGMVGGNTKHEAISNWETVLTKLNNNNLKVATQKVRIMPTDTRVL